MSAQGKAFSKLQYIIPQHGYSKTIRKLSTLRVPVASDLIIKGFSAAFKPDMANAKQPDLNAYDDLNDFFTRELEPNARPLEGKVNDLHSPADGKVSEFGRIRHDKLLQAKGRDYSVGDLLASPSLAEEFLDGSFVTVYLAPHNYHRVHMPLGGRLRSMLHVPGRLFSVNQATAENVPNLFARNERVVTIFDTDEGPLALILVGAMGVGHIETTWHGSVEPKAGKKVTQWHYPADGDDCIDIAAGDEMGRFNLGSTAIVLTPKNTKWLDKVAVGLEVRVGSLLGELG